MKKKSNVFIYMILVSSVLFAKVLGLARSILLSAVYGTGVEASAFTAVSNLPLIIFDVTFGTAITSAFIPVFNEKLSAKGKDGANKFASNFFNIILMFSFFIVVLGVLFPDKAVMLVASGFKDDVSAMSIATVLMRIIMPIMSFACCTYIFIGILQSYGEFVAPALVSVLSNLSMVVYLLFFNDRFGISGLAIAFCLGWFLQFTFLLPFLKKKGFKYSFILNFKAPDIRKVAILTLPLFVAALAQPINQLISSNFSSRISAETGAATVNYAYTAYLIVAGVFSYALTNMFFPEMSRKFAENDVDGATTICTDMLSAISAIIFPIMAFMGICSKPIIMILYQRGEFTSADTANVSSLLAIYTLGMILLSWQDIMNKYFYSMQKSYIPMICAIAGITVNLGLSFVLTPVLGLSGLAISTVIAGLVMTCILSIFSFNTAKSIFPKSFIIEMLKLIAGGLTSCAVCALLMHIISFETGFIMKVVYLLILFVCSVISYLVVLLLLRSQNISNITKLLKKGNGA